MRLKFEVLMCVFLCFALTFPASAQKVNLEELEAQLKREQAKEAEANRKTDASRRAAAAMGTLIVRVDADCALRVNTQDKGQLSANQSQTVKVAPGEQLIECDAGGGRMVETVETVPSGEQKVVRLTVPPQVRFFLVADGVEDNEQGIVWASSDNGSNIDWNGATSYCASKGSGWSLPMVAQATSMFDATGQYQQPRSNQYGNWTIKPATDLIQFSQGTVAIWTSERDGSSSAFAVDLDNGSRYSATVSYSSDVRALCVRRRS